MNRFFAIFALLTCAMFAQDYSGSTTPTLNDSDVILLRKIAKSLNDARSGSAPLNTAASPSKGTAIATAKVALSSSASQVSALNAARRSITVRNLDAAISVYIGASGVSSANGFLLKPGETITLNSTAAIFAVAASGTPSVNIITEND